MIPKTENELKRSEALFKEGIIGQEKLDGLKREQEALGEDIAKKRRYVKRRGKTDINKIKRLNAEIEALKQSPNPDPEKIKELEAEVQETKEKF